MSFLGWLRELPVVEAGTEFGGDRLVSSRAIVVAEVVVGETDGFGDEPALALVLRHEGLDSGFAVAACGLDVPLQVGEGDLG